MKEVILTDSDFFDDESSEHQSLHYWASKQLLRVSLQLVAHTSSRTSSQARGVARISLKPA